MQSTEHPTRPSAISLLTGVTIAGTIALFAAQSGGVPAGSEVNWLNQLAVSGDPGAQMELGLAYRDGRYGLHRDPDLGSYWLKKAAHGGNAYAADAVANMYASGDDFTGLQQALPWWEQAATGGNSDAQVHLGEYLMIKGQDNQAVTWLRDAADRGDGRAHNDLVSLYREDSLPGSDLHRGENPLAALGERADSAGIKSLYAVWRTFEASSPTTQSADALINRAENGDPVAEYQLAVRYRDGSWAVERDPQKSLIWLERSAEAGNRIAEKALTETQYHTRSGISTTSGAATGGSRT